MSGLECLERAFRASPQIAINELGSRIELSVADVGYLATSGATAADEPESLSRVYDGGDTQRMTDELQLTHLTLNHAVNLSSTSYVTLCTAVSILYTCLLLLTLHPRVA